MALRFSDALARYASDHCKSGTDKTTSHAYGELYDTLFAPLKDRARRVLEVGVYSGASVVAMADFFLNAEVVGVDVTHANILFGRANPRVRYVLGDATQASTVDALRSSTFDLILDDGSHLLDDQEASL